MSADNYLYVGRTPDGTFGYEMRFASFTDDYPETIDNETVDPKFVTADAAIKAAHVKATHEYYEYGVAIAPDVMKEWSAA